MIVTAAPDLIPPPLINQLKAGGRMVNPVGLPDAQQLVVAAKDMNGRVRTKEIMQVLFSLLEGPDRDCFPRILTTMVADFSGGLSTLRGKACQSSVRHAHR